MIRATIDGDVELTREEEIEFAAKNAEREGERQKREIIEQIRLLENSVTERRKREAILGTDNGWLHDIERQIYQLRQQI